MISGLGGGIDAYGQITAMRKSHEHAIVKVTSSGHTCLHWHRVQSLHSLRASGPAIRHRVSTPCLPQVDGLPLIPVEVAANTRPSVLEVASKIVNVDARQPNKAHAPRVALRARASCIAQHPECGSFMEAGE